MGYVYSSRIFIVDIEFQSQTDNHCNPNQPLNKDIICKSQECLQ
jgi:hypothetical protein